MDEKNNDLLLCLEELRIHISVILQAGDSLDKKMNNTLSAAGLIMAITSTLQISLLPDETDLYWSILILAVILYLIAVGLALFGINPKSYKLPIAADWEELDKHIIGKDERKSLLTLISGYVEQINHNSKINQRKTNIFRINLIILSLIVLALLSLVPISALG